MNSNNKKANKPETKPDEYSQRLTNPWFLNPISCFSSHQFRCLQEAVTQRGRARRVPETEKFLAAARTSLNPLPWANQPQAAGILRTQVQHCLSPGAQKLECQGLVRRKVYFIPGASSQGRWQTSSLTNFMSVSREKYWQFLRRQPRGES